jgi:cell wall-associated NlpC family hydrolase
MAASWYARRRLGIEALVTPAPAAAARGGARLRARAPRWGAVVVALAALAGTAAGRVPVPGSGTEYASAAGTASAARTSSAAGTAAPHKLLRADVMVVAQKPLPARDVARVARLRGVQAARAVDAARIRVNGTFAAVLGVDPATFRAFAAGPTASASPLWRNVADGAIAVSYTMGKQDKLPLGGTVQVAGRTLQSLRVAGFGTVGIGGVDAVISRTAARSLGFPEGNAIVVSAPHDRVAALVRQIKARMPHGAVVEPLVTTSATGTPAAAGVAGASVAAGATAGAAANGQAALTTAELIAMLRAAASRVGYPYVWGGSGPTTFDCSGLVQWSFRQAGVVMPRVAADQARTGPAIPFSQARAGDLLFYRTDPTAPDYISHVAIYLGKGLMIQAPEPGENVQIVPVALGSEFAGVVRVSPAIAAQVAASPVG